MARSKNTAPRAAHSAAGTATGPAPAPVAPAAGGSPAAAVLAALSAHPAGAAVTVIAAHAGISVTAARQALIAHEKAGAVTRTKGSRPGIPDTWKPAAPPTEAQPAEAPPAPAPGAGSTAGGGQPTPAADGGSAAGGEADVGAGPVPDLAAEAAASVQALAQAVGTAGKALAAGDLAAALAALEAARDQATLGRRAIKAAASGQRTPAARPGALRELVEEHLRKFPGTAFTPHQVGKVLTRSAGAVANALDKLVALGTAQLVTDKPRSYQLAPAAAVGGPGASAEATSSVA